MKLINIFILFLFSFVVHAENLILLYDTGESTILNKGIDTKIRIERPDPIKVLKERFPIVSSAWQLGEFNSVNIKFPEMRSPVFFVGCDDLSLGWVQHRKTFLQEKRALGFVINCQTHDDYTAFKAAIYPLIVQAANMDKLAGHLKHNKYPAYVHARAIEQ